MLFFLCFRYSLSSSVSGGYHYHGLHRLYCEFNSINGIEANLPSPPQLTLSITAVCFIHVVPLVAAVQNFSDEVQRVAEVLARTEFDDMLTPLNLSEATLILFDIVLDSTTAIAG